MDEGGDDQARADHQRGEDLAERRPQGALRLPWLLVRTALVQEERKGYLGASPSKKSMQRFKTKVGETLVPANMAPWEDVRDKLNSMLIGCSRYFSYGATASAYKHVNWHVYQRARDFLTRRHKVQGRGTARFSCEVVYGELGLIRLERLPRSYTPWAAREASRRA